MRIVVDFPPNIGDIRAVLPITGREMFSWGDIIFNPGGGKLSKELLAHERTHAKQQAGDVEGWWIKYLHDIEFRFQQELEAHQVEYAVNRRLQPNRNLRRLYLKEISKRLASPMYGSIITYEKARKMIVAGPK